MIAVFHNIRSMHNIGSLFRTADALGVEKVYLTGYSPAPVDRFGNYRLQIAKVALGAEKNVPWEKRFSASNLIRELRRSGRVILAIEQSQKSTPYYRFRMVKEKKNRAVLIVGNEVRGLSKNILKLADKILEIPMNGQKESLNVSVAFAVVAYDLKYN